MSWDRIRGHHRIREQFEHALETNRLGQAYLFLGPDGIGKKLFAIQFAKSLLCENHGHRLRSCERCASCLLVAAKTHPDLTITGKPDDKTELPISTIRELIGVLGMKANRGTKKFAIIDDSDDFNEESANAFLKTLEEPPAGTVLILLGTSADVQLPTILSRCQLIRFEPLAESDVVLCLQADGVNSDDANQLAKFAKGSPGRAVALNVPELWDVRSQIIKVLATSPFRRSALHQIWIPFIEAAGKSAPKQRLLAQQSIGLMLDFVIGSMRLANGSEKSGLMPGDVDPAMNLARSLDPDRMLDAIDRLRQADDRIRSLVPPITAIEALIDHLGRLAQR